MKLNGHNRVRSHLKALDGGILLAPTTVDLNTVFQSMKESAIAIAAWMDVGDVIEAASKQLSDPPTPQQARTMQLFAALAEFQRAARAILTEDAKSQPTETETNDG